ncbi:MAG: recX [Firmicutes bacterium]|nr:recX [Bacillota bacterium]
MEKKITSIENQKKCSDRVNVYLDGEYAFACSLDTVVKYKLILGKSVDSSYLSSIIEEDNYVKGKAYAFRILERGMKSEKEILTKLQGKGFDEKTCTKVISLLKDYGYIDDGKLSDMYINQKLKSEGANRIKGFLYRKGIPEAVIKEKVDGIDEDAAEETAYNLAIKKYIRMAAAEEDKRKLYRKLGDFLVRRGYSYDISKKVLNRIFNEYYGGE